MRVREQQVALERRPTGRLGRTLLDSEVQKMPRAAINAAHDPTIETDAEVWRKAKAEAMNLDGPGDVGDYIDSRLRESDRQQEEQEEAEPAEEVTTPRERLQELEAEDDAQRELIERVLSENVGHQGDE